MTNANELIIEIAKLIQYAVIPIIIGIALIMFLIGVVKYALSSDESKRKSAVAIIINGLIILFVMVSVWGMVWLVASFFNINLASNTTTIPDKQIRPQDLILKGGSSGSSGQGGNGNRISEPGNSHNK